MVMAVATKSVLIRSAVPDASLLVLTDDGKLRRRIESALVGSHVASFPVAVGFESVRSGEWDGEAIMLLGCDLDLPGDLARLRSLRRQPRRPRIVAVCPATTGTGVRRGLDAGADGIVFGDELEATLVTAVAAVASGQSVVPRNYRAGVERPTFSNRERQVLICVVRGLTNAQIAEELYLAESTIKSHLSSAFTKFGVRSRREAAALFLETDPAGAID